MSGKTLSTGTLSLRFMQNAQRAKQIKEVELEKAHVEDDGQWEIAKEIRESWGSPAENDNTVSYEQSYLPFLFPSVSGSVQASTDTIPKGRRVFKRGKEVTVTPVSDPPPEVAPLANSPSSSSLRSTKSDSGSTRRPITKSTKVAKLAIFDNSQVGTDLRNNRLASSSSSRNVFLKPAGVDVPKSSGTNNDISPSAEGIITSAREVKVKRERKISTTQADLEDGPKRKKKK
ncbi:hypothetical protein BDP27DRAFT_1326836, partial [Rhodocollybia butyracea]